VPRMAQGKSRRRRGKYRRSRACGTKKAHTQAEAESVAFALSKKSGVRYKAYKCPFCYLASGAVAWHVGHSTSLARRLR